MSLKFKVFISIHDARYFRLAITRRYYIEIWPASRIKPSAREINFMTGDIPDKPALYAENFNSYAGIKALLVISPLL